MLRFGTVLILWPLQRSVELLKFLVFSSLVVEAVEPVHDQFFEEPGHCEVHQENNEEDVQVVLRNRSEFKSISRKLVSMEEQLGLVGNKDQQANKEYRIGPNWFSEWFGSAEHESGNNVLLN